MADKHKSVTSSTYSGDSTSEATARSETIQKAGSIDSKIAYENMRRSGDESKKKRQENRAAKERREAGEAAAASGKK